jgi:NitT/TauT family transport system ATP-binding protein
MAPIITLSAVGKIYDGSPNHSMALKAINLNIQKGEFFIFVGPSGCGKSTLLRIMSGLDKQTHGTVTLKNGITRNDMSFVFQNFALLPWLTVAENIEMGLVGRSVPKDERMAIVKNELKIFGLKKYGNSHPHDLSGGMRQRVGIARAFASNPSLLFMDEPFSELDSFTAEELRKELLSIWKERGTTIIMVTHIVQEAIELADRIAVMKSNPGQIEKIFVNKLARPRSMRTDTFFKMEDAIYDKIR